MNIGRYQVIYWPRLTLAYYRHRPMRGIYSWVFYLWPIELRRFADLPKKAGQ